MASQGVRMNLGVAAAAAWLALAGGAQAAVQGDRLMLELPCSSGQETVAIVPDASLSHGVDIDGSTSGVSTRDGEIRVSGSCQGDGELTIRVPPAFMVSVSSASSGDLRLGNLDGFVTVGLRGSGDLDGGQLGGKFVLENSGGGDVHLGGLAGDATLSLFGSGDLSVGSVRSGSVTLIDSGSSDVNLGAGSIGALSATLSGSGDLAVAAVVGGGNVVTSGSGDITIARVVGDLVQTQTGSGSITVHARGTEAAPTPAPQDVRRSSPQEDASDGPHLGADIFHAVLTFALVAFAVWFWRKRRRRTRAMSAARDPRVEATVDRLNAVAKRVGRLEAVVTSREFDLNRRFREMGD